MWRIGLLIFPIILVRAIPIICPEKCYCYTETDTRLRVANCTTGALFDDQSVVVDVANFHPPRYHSIRLGAKTFENFRSTKYLTFTNMKIKSIPDDTFHGMNNLLEIDLSYNKIKNINGIIYKNLKSLKGLYLRGNPLQLILFDVIVSKSLKELDMGYCGLSDLPSGIFDQVPALMKLYLDGNSLTTLHFSLLPPGLTYLNLANNQIVDVPVNVLKSLRSLQTVNLSENPINCTCSLLAMQDYFANDGRDFENGATCASPLRYSGKSLSQLNEHELCKMELMPDPSTNSIRHLLGSKSSLKYTMQGDQGSVQSDQPFADTEAAFIPDREGLNKLDSTSEEGISDTDAKIIPDEPLQVTNPDSTITEVHNNMESDKDVSENHSKETFSPKRNNEDLYLSWVQKIISSDSTLRPDSKRESDFPAEYNYEETHPDYHEETTEGVKDEVEGSGDGGSLDITPPTYKFLEEQENETVTEDYSVENVTDTFDTATEKSLSSTESSSTEPTSPKFSESSSTTEQSDDYIGEFTTSEETTTPGPSHAPIHISSTEISSTPVVETETTPGSSHAPSVDTLDYSAESTTPVVETETSPEPSMSPVIEPEIFKKETHEDKEGVESKEGFSKEEGDRLQALTIYIIAGLVIALLVNIILILVCKRRKRKSVKISLPVDPEANAGTELQDMLLPKPPENGIKVIPKAYTNGNAANGKGESKEEETPVLAEPREAEQDWEDKLGPIEAVTARMCVLARPQTPIFIHKSLN